MRILFRLSAGFVMLVTLALHPSVARAQSEGGFVSGVPPLPAIQQLDQYQQYRLRPDVQTTLPPRPRFQEQRVPPPAAPPPPPSGPSAGPAAPKISDLCRGLTLEQARKIKICIEG